MARKRVARCGTIEGIRPILREGRLKVRVWVDLGEGRIAEAFLPDRETAALLPRSLLAAGHRELPAALLDTLRSMLQRLATGRQVRLWDYQGAWYCSFLSWRVVRFQEEQPGEPMPGQDAEGDGDVQRALRPG